MYTDTLKYFQTHTAQAVNTFDEVNKQFAKSVEAHIGLYEKIVRTNIELSNAFSQQLTKLFTQ